MSKINLSNWEMVDDAPNDRVVIRSKITGNELELHQSGELITDNINNADTVTTDTLNAQGVDAVSVNTEQTNISVKSQIAVDAKEEFGNPEAIGFSKRISKNGTDVSFTTAAEVTHNGGVNRAVFVDADLVVGDVGSAGAPITDSAKGFIRNKDQNWGTAGSTTNISNNIRLKVDDNDNSKLLLQANLDTNGNGFENGIFSAKLSTNSNPPIVVDPPGWTS